MDSLQNIDMQHSMLYNIVNIPQYIPGGDCFGKKQRMDHLDLIKQMINELGIDETDNKLREDLIYLSKKVATLREKIDSIKLRINNENNSDEKRHLEFELEETKKSLKEMLYKLKSTDTIYILYKDYIKT
ncbi:MAG: hypothetical protein PWQ37_2701 [Candidatus Petromonas sp.]|nr:hypothetical protein [Candidatus Petromonas sp.]